MIKPIQTLRLVGIIVIAFCLAYFTPQFFSQGAIYPANNVIFIFAFLLGFLLNRALERKHMIESSSGIEVTRLRRMVHLAEAVDDKVWGAGLKAAIVAYHRQVSDDMHDHAKNDALFREITHPIYGYHPVSPHDQALYAELMQTTREIALERQHLEHALKGGTSAQSWLVVLLLTGLAVLLLLSNIGLPNYSKFGVGAIISGILLMLDLLYHTDRMSAREISRLQRAYGKNLAAFD